MGKISRRVFLVKGGIIGLSSLLLTACKGQLPQVLTSTLAPAPTLKKELPTIASNLKPTETVTPTLTSTPEPSPTRVVDLGDLQDPSTWLTEFVTDEGEIFNVKSYWADTDFSTNGRPDQELAKKQDQYFDQFVNASMRKILENTGINTGLLSNQQIFEQYLTLEQQNKEVATISPQRIRQILGDIDNYVIAYSNGTEEIIGILSDSINYNLSFLDLMYNSIKNSQMNLNIFGVETTVPAENYGGVNGNLVALGRIPGKNPEEAVIAVTAYPNYNITNTDGTHPTAYYPVIINFQDVSINMGDEYLAVNLNSSNSSFFMAQAVDGGTISAVGISYEDLTNLLGHPVFIQSHDSSSWVYIGGKNTAGEKQVAQQVFPFNLGLQHASDVVPIIQTSSTP